MQFKGTLRLGSAPGGWGSQQDSRCERVWIPVIHCWWQATPKHSGSSNSNLLFLTILGVCCAVPLLISPVRLLSAGGFTGLEGPRWPHSHVGWLELAASWIPRFFSSTRMRDTTAHPPLGLISCLTCGLGVPRGQRQKLLHLLRLLCRNPPMVALLPHSTG